MERQEPCEAGCGHHSLKNRVSKGTRLGRNMVCSWNLKEDSCDWRESESAREEVDTVTVRRVPSYVGVNDLHK